MTQPDSYKPDTGISQYPQKIGDLLVDFHGQHEHQSLLNEENHLLIIDNLPEVKRRKNHIRFFMRRGKKARLPLKNFSRKPVHYRKNGTFWNISSRNSRAWNFAVVKKMNWNRNYRFSALQLNAPNIQKRSFPCWTHPGIRYKNEYL